MGIRKPPTLQSKGWSGFNFVYFKFCGKQFRHSLRWASCAVVLAFIVSVLSPKPYYDLLVVLTSIGLKVAPPLLGFTLSGYALVIGVNDANVSERLKRYKTKTGITMYQQLYTTFIAMLGSIFLLLVESVILHYALESGIMLSNSIVVGIVNISIFLIYSFTMFYALFAVKDLLSNLFSLGQTINNIHQETHKQ